MKHVLCAAAFLLAAIPALTQTTPAPATPAKTASCHADKSPRSAAMIDYDRNDYTKAAGEFTSELIGHENDDRLRAASIRNLIEKGDVAEATKEADAFAAAKPNSGLAQTTKAEAMIRNGQLAEAYALAASSQKLDPCVGRTYYTLATYEDMIALFATAKRHIELAHALDPVDPEITSAWIVVQPRAKARAEWESFVETSSAFTDKQRENAKARIAKQKDKTETDECKLISGPEEATIPFSAIRYSPNDDPAYGLEMTFNGKKRRLELDTGASGLTLTQSAAQRLGLTIEDAVSIGGIGDEGHQKGQKAHVADLKIGPLEFANCTVDIMAPRNMDYAGQGLPPFMDDIDGLVGGDIFRKFLLTLDYPAGELKVSPLPPRPNEQAGSMSLSTTGGEGTHSTTGTDEVPQDRFRSPQMKDWTQFYRIYHYLLIPTQLDNGPVKLMMADTGAFDNLIDPAAARLVTKVSTTNKVSVRGLSGVANSTYLTDKIVLHFANLYLPLPWMIATETTTASRSAGVEISGFLGFPALRQMELQIDYRDDLIHFVFDPKRKPNPKFARQP